MRYRYLHSAVFLVLVCVLCIGLFVARQLEQRRDHVQAEAAYAQIESTPAVPVGYPLPVIFSTEPVPTLGPAVQQPAWEQPEMLAEYSKLYAQNQDLAGWISLPGTLLNLPVMHTPGDAEYYLHRLFDKQESLYGTPFLDARCSITPPSTNLILHGHHMRDETMFGVLEYYVERSFFEENPRIYFDTLYEKGTYEVFSVFQSVYDPQDQDPSLYYRFVDAQDPTQFERYVEDVTARSMYDTGVRPQAGDHLLTLITCSYHAPNGRLTIVCRRVPPDVPQEQHS